jgi:uncharacterized protein (DUF924 family)
MNAQPDDIVNFWFYEVGADRWFNEDRTLDATMREKFLVAYEMAASDQLENWLHTPEGCMALLLLLDVFPRRLFRGTSRAFETDDKAIEVAREAIIRHFDDRIDRQFKLFFYLPFLNSESLGDQRLALYYIRERAKEDKWLSVAEQQYEIVQRFGRFPDRNPLLGRQPTPEEIEFLKRSEARQSA